MSARLHAPTAAAALAVGLAAALALGAMLGETRIPARDVAAVLVGDPQVDPVVRAQVLQLRMPQSLVAALVGGCLALAGTLLQGIFRNPLAAPDVLGIGAGGTLGAVLALYSGLASVHLLALPAAAFAGATVVAFAVYALATRGGRTDMATLLLTGLAVQAFVSAMSGGAIALSAKQWEVARSIMAWTLGGLEDRTWDHVLAVAPAAALALAGAVLHGRELNILALGEREAATLGVDPAALRRSALVLASLATGAAVAVGGSIAFVGLIVPHLLRSLVGPDHRGLLPVSFLGGACFLAALDLFQRTVLRGLLNAPELRVGILTGLLGAPFFLYLLYTQRRAWYGG